MDVSTPTYRELIKLLNKAETAASSRQPGVLSTAELLTTQFSRLYPHIKIGRPGRFLETVRRIDGPIRNGKLKGTCRQSYLKRRWTPRTRNPGTQCEGMYNYTACLSVLGMIVSVLPRNWPRRKGRVEFLPTSKDLRPHPFPHQSKFILKA